MNVPALERTRAMIGELKAAGVKPFEESGPKDDALRMSGWGRTYKGCGTIGCLAGWMTLDPELQKMGLHNHGHSLLTPDYASLEPAYGGKTGDDALQLFLGMNDSVVWYLFAATHPNSWDAALERIDDVLEGRIK